MKRTSTYALCIYALLTIILVAETGCHPYRCPANGGSVDHVDIKKMRRHKPQSGLWPKGMRR